MDGLCFCFTVHGLVQNISRPSDLLVGRSKYDVLMTPLFNVLIMYSEVQIIELPSYASTVPASTIKSINKYVI